MRSAPCHNSGFLLALFPVPLVELLDNLLHGARHILETPLPATLYGICARKRDHIIVPVRALRAGWGLCSFDRYNFVGLSHYVRPFSGAPWLTLSAGSSTNLPQCCKFNPFYSCPGGNALCSPLFARDHITDFPRSVSCRAAAYGRKQTVKTPTLIPIERLLWVKADILLPLDRQYRSVLDVR